MPLLTLGQNVTSYGIWLDYLSYANTVGVAENGRYVYTAGEKGVFIVDKEEESITKKSKLNGLSDINVTAIEYAKSVGVLVIGYSNGNIDLLSEGGNVTNLSDIKRSTKNAGLKNINSIYIIDEFAYVCLDFGIVKIDLKRLIVLETWLVGDQGTPTSVKQVAFNEPENRWYLVDDDGVKSASANSPLIFYGSWTTTQSLPPGVYNKVASANGRVMVNWQNPINDEDSIYVYESGSWSHFGQKAQGRTYQIKGNKKEFIITTGFNVQVYNENLGLRLNISNALFTPGKFFPKTAALDPDGTTLYISDFTYGMYRVRNGLGVKNFVPDGPASNNPYSLRVIDEALYVVRGSINEVWAPQFYFEGIYKYSNFAWSHLTSTDLGDSRDLLDLVGVNNKVYAASWGKGLVEIENNQYVATYDDSNSDGKIQSVGGTGNDFRIGGLAVDNDGTLWFTNALVNNNLCSLSPDGVFSNYTLGSLGGFQTSIKDIDIDDNGNIFLQPRNGGVIGFRINNGQPQVASLKQGEGSGNLPSNGVLSFAVDKDGELWIGTDEGLVVQYDTEAMFSGGANSDAQPIIFKEEGVNQKLLGIEAVTDIAIDGANNKWFGTARAGVFYTSENGRETIYRFTAENSPLLSNTILDIEIDPISGEVFFATPEGIISYRGQATEGFEEYTDVYAYPNPVEPGYEGPIAIKGLVTNARVKITDLEGNIVSEMVANGGQAIWDGRTLDGQLAASGVYMAYCTNDDGSKTHVTKILVVR